MELADGVVEAAQGRRARAPRAHRCTGRSRTTPSAHSATFFGQLQKAGTSILPRGRRARAAPAAPCGLTAAGPNCREKLFYPGAAHGERVRPRGVRQTCQAEAGAPGGALAVPRRARPPLGRTCKVRPRPRSPVFRGAHGRLAPPTGRARPSGACQTCRAEAGAPGGALAVPLRARLLYPAHSGLLNPILRGYT